MSADRVGQVQPPQQQQMDENESSTSRAPSLHNDSDRLAEHPAGGGNAVAPFAERAHVPQTAADSLDWKGLLALNYDLLLQFPIHRRPGNCKLTRRLDASGADAKLTREETLTNEALDLIERLADAKSGDISKSPTACRKRLQKLLPLLLYRYRPSDSPSVGIEQDLVDADGQPLSAEKQLQPEMSIVRNRIELHLLAFNFRPFNSGLCYRNWPLGRTKEVCDDTSSAEQIYYVAEPVDKVLWLESKRAAAPPHEPLDVGRMYGGQDNQRLFFKMYAPRARALRKARFRSTRAESHDFRKFIFGTCFYGDAPTARTWEQLWNTALPSLRYDQACVGHAPAIMQKRRMNQVANLLALLQPASMDEMALQLRKVDQTVAHATVWWSAEQVAHLEALLRATVYEQKVDANLVVRKNHLLLGTVAHADDSGVAQRAMTLWWYTALRSKFDPTFDGESRNAQTFNIMLRTIVSLERSLSFNNGKTVAYLPPRQLWHLSGILINFVRLHQDTRGTFQRIDFVQRLVAHIGDLTTLFDSDLHSIGEFDVDNVLLNNL